MAPNEYEAAGERLRKATEEVVAAMSDLMKLWVTAIEEVKSAEPWCSQCDGPYKEDWLVKQYGGHWDTCPNRHAFESSQKEHQRRTIIPEEYGGEPEEVRDFQPPEGVEIVDGGGYSKDIIRMMLKGQKLRIYTRASSDHQWAPLEEYDKAVAKYNEIATNLVHVQTEIGQTKQHINQLKTDMNQLKTDEDNCKRELRAAQQYLEELIEQGGA